MRIVRSGSIAALVLLACFFTATAQDVPTSSTQAAPQTSAPAVMPDTPNAAQNPEPAPQSSLTLNDVLDRVVQREHLFMAQMRHMHPMVETYLQDLKKR